MNKVCKHCSIEFIDKSRSHTAEYCSISHKNASWYLCNRDHAIDRCQKYESVNAEKIKNRKREYAVNRRQKDINFKLAFTLRCRLTKSVKNNAKNGSFIKDLGCSMEQLKQYLESKFQPGMNWNNWSRNGWHIDHIRPLVSFNLSNREDFLKACNYRNLQPLWAKDNLSKSDYYEKR